MINLSEIQSNIKNIEMICPRCFKYHLSIFHNGPKDLKYWNLYIKQLKKIYNKNPKCSNNLNCLNLILKWCTQCLNWFCEECSKIHICDNNIEFRDYAGIDHRKTLLTKNNININNKCPFHNKPYLFYCDIHLDLCEDCNDCSLVLDKRYCECSHYYCYFGPIWNLIIKSEIKNIKKKIEKIINFFNTYIFNLYNNNKDKYNNIRRKRFERNFKKYRKNFVSFLEFIFLLIKTSQKNIVFSSFLYIIFDGITFEFKKFEYDKNIKNKSLKNFNSQLSNYFSTQFSLIYNNNDYFFFNEEKNSKIDIDLSKYNLNLISNNFNYFNKNKILNDWYIEISEEEFNSLNILEFNKNFFIEFDENDLKYKNLLRENYYEGKYHIKFSPKFKDNNGNIFLHINREIFCVIEEKKNNIYKIIFFKSEKIYFNDVCLKKIKLINKNLIALIFEKSIIILSLNFPFSILKKIIINKKESYYNYNYDFKFFSLIYNPNIFIFFNNDLYYMQIYNINNFQLISNVYGIFGHQILEINSNLILITYFADEESLYLMLVVDIYNLKVLNCVSFNKNNYYYSKKFRALKNPKFYLYSNQIEFLAINYPQFMKNNIFIKNDVQIKLFDNIIKVDLFKNDDLAITYNEGLIIENKNIFIPKVKNFSFTENDNILICYFYEYININWVYSLKVIKLKDNNYEIIDSIKIQNYIEEIVKINNNRFISYGKFSDDKILLWIIDENNTLKYSKINELKDNDTIEKIFVLTNNNKIIIPLYNKKNNILQFWKINDNNTIEKIFDINLNQFINNLLDYDNDILIVVTSNYLFFINLNNFQIMSRIVIEFFRKEVVCMRKLMNGNILFCVRGKRDYDIIEYKFNKIKCELFKFKFISNAAYVRISKILEMKNGHIITIEKYNNVIEIWKNNEFNKIND